MRNIISKELYNNILLVFKNLKNNKINQQTIKKLEESLSKQDYSRTRNIFETEIFTIKGCKRKTNKRKTNKRKTNKKKTNKRKLKNYYGGEGGEDDECPTCGQPLKNDDPDNPETIIHYPLTSTGAIDMTRPHITHKKCVEAWLDETQSIKEIADGTLRFECPQCTTLLKPENIVNDELRENVKAEMNAFNEDEDEPLVRVNLNNVPNVMLHDLDFLIDLLTRIATNEHVITIVIMGLAFSYILNLHQ
jgi:uncharacterized protein (UPF0212 family)